MVAYLMTIGLGSTVNGENRAKKDSTKPGEASKYARLNLLLWERVYKAIKPATTT